MSIASESNTVTPAAAPAAGQDDAVDTALAAAAEDAGKIGDLLDVLRTARLWLPLPDDGTPVISGSSVTLPTVSYLGSDFIPAYSSAEMLQRLTICDRPAEGYGGPATRVAAVPHAVVRAADLARLLPPSVGIALNAGAAESVPVYPQGVAYLAAGADTDRVSMGPAPAGSEHLIAAIRSALAIIPDVSRAAAAWLIVRFSGEGLVISVSLDYPANHGVQDAVVAAIERAAEACETEFPIDVTFPGDGESDRVDSWFASSNEAFYRR
jgi:hypothetical protein